MTKFCESCHTPNKDGAKYCAGCNGRFSGIRFAAHKSAADFPESQPQAAHRLADLATLGRPRRNGPVLLLLVLLLGVAAAWDLRRAEPALAQLRDTAGAWTRSALARVAGAWNGGPGADAARGPGASLVPASPRSGPAPAPPLAVPDAPPSEDAGRRDKRCAAAQVALALCPRG